MVAAIFTSKEATSKISEPGYYPFNPNKYGWPFLKWNLSFFIFLKLNLSGKTYKSFLLHFNYGSDRNNLYSFIISCNCERIIFALVQRILHNPVRHLMEHFAKIVNGWKPKFFILDAWHWPKYASGCYILLFYYNKIIFRDFQKGIH